MTKYTLASSREWYNNLPGKRSSAAMIIRYNGKILMIKDDYKQALTFPGGVIDPDESAKTAAIRETSEEVGITFRPDEVTFHSMAYVSEHNGFKDRFHFFFIADIAHEPTVQSDQGIEYVTWAAPNEIGALSGDRKTYVELQTMLTSGTVIPYFEV